MLLIRKLSLLVAFSFICIFLFIFHRINTPPESLHSTLHWVQHEAKYPVSSYVPLPTGLAEGIPQIQHDFEPESEADKKIRLERRSAVKEAFLHAWKGYTDNAWKKDEVSPVSGSFYNSFGGWGATLVDTMDTLWIMGLKDDFERCVKVVEDIDFTTNANEVMNVFETTIRFLGGLLAVHDLTHGKYPVLLMKAVELGDILYTAFDTPNRMPMTRWEWHQSAFNNPTEASESTILAEFGSLSLEFTRLSQTTGDLKYFDAIQRITDELDAVQMKTKIPGLWPIVVNARDLTFDFNLFTFGGMADSTYEYLPKQHLLLRGRTSQYREMYESALKVAKKYLFFRPMNPDHEDILFSGRARVDDNGHPLLDPQGQHLSCFAGGMLGLASRIFDRPEDMKLARQLVDGCVWAYQSFPSGVMPETFHLATCQVGAQPMTSSCNWTVQDWHNAILAFQFDSAAPGAQLTGSPEYLIKEKGLVPGFTDLEDVRYSLRPDLLESLFILHRLTGLPHYTTTAWHIFQQIESATRTPIAHAGLRDVRIDPTNKSTVDPSTKINTNLEDRMESFWLAKTLKYAYLTFEEPEVLDLGEWVFSTEAHPFRLEREVVG